MITHNILQGTPAWLAYRLQHFNASDAPAMLGVSPYKTRTQLLHELHTGIAPEVDTATQRRFDAGHSTEARARTLAEEIIGEELYPVTGSEGKLSASFDGLTMDERIVWEHKLMNVTLAESLADGVIPDSYHPQLEQQLMVSGAEKALFMATSLDQTAMEHVWYTSRPELRSAIIAGWQQFAIDLENYVPVAPEVKAVAAPQFGLPAVSIQVNGSIALIDNLQAFGTALTAYVEKINLKPETDQDFADLEATVKTLKNAEDALDAAESGALAQTESIDAMRRTVAMYRDTARTNRLLVDKLVKVEKDNRKMAIVRDAGAEFASHLNGLNERLGRSYMPAIHTDFPGAVKGLKSIDSMRDKVATELARAKIDANSVADKIDANLRHLSDVNAPMFLFSDLQSICLKSTDDFQMLVKARINDHTEKEAVRIAAETARIAEQERVKAQARADAEIAEATAKAQAQALADAEAKRASDDAIAEAAQREVFKNRVYAPDPELTLGTAPPCHQTVIVPAGRDDITPTMRLGEISERLGFAVTAVFLSELGFEPCATDKMAKLYKARLFPVICRELVKHIQSVCELQAA